MGSTRDDCDQMTGQCKCKEGVKGVKCSQCERDGSWVTSRGCANDAGDDILSFNICNSCVEIALKKAVFALGFKKPSAITFLCSFVKSCLSQKLFLTHTSVGLVGQCVTRSFWNKHLFSKLHER